MNISTFDAEERMGPTYWDYEHLEMYLFLLWKCV